MREFSPVKVRLALEKLGVATPVGKDMYKTLSERATHVTPHTRPELYSAVDHPLASGTFQEGGVRTCLDHLGYAIGVTAMAATKLIRPPQDRAERIIRAAEFLIGSA